MNRIIIRLFAILYSTNLYSQDNVSGARAIHTVSFNTQYIQIKDEFNYGLVFSGPNLVAGYSFAKITDKDILRYSPEIGFGGVFNKGAGFAWRFKPIDLCVADNGRWKGQQIISSDWIDEMTSMQTQIDYSNYSFGYFWWIDETRNIYFMWGAGGQFAFIVPDKKLVVVMTSFPNTKGEYEIQADEALSIVDRIIDVSK